MGCGIDIESQVNRFLRLAKPSEGEAAHLGDEVLDRRLALEPELLGQLVCEATGGVPEPRAGRTGRDHVGANTVAAELGREGLRQR